MNIKRKLGEAFRGGLAALALYAGTPGCGTGTIGIVPGQTAPAINLADGPFAKSILWESDCQRPGGDCRDYTLANLLAPIGVKDIVLVGVIPNYSGGDLGILAGLVPDSSAFRPGPFTVTPVVSKDVNGFVTKFQLCFKDNEEPFVNGNPHLVVYQAIGIDGVSRPWGELISYLSPPNTGIQVPSTDGTPCTTLTLNETLAGNRTVFYDPTTNAPFSSLAHFGANSSLEVRIRNEQDVDFANCYGINPPQLRLAETGNEPAVQYDAASFNPPLTDITIAPNGDRIYTSSMNDLGEMVIDGVTKRVFESTATIRLSNTSNPLIYETVNAQVKDAANDGTIYSFDKTMSFTAP